MEYNLVEAWLRRDPIRWLAGVLGGLLAGGAAIAVAAFLASMNQLDLWFPVKLMAAIILGPNATDIANRSSTIWVGILVIESICVFWGVIYSHFVVATRIPSLLAMGLVWGLFSWIFLWDLVLQSFQVISAAEVVHWAVLPVCLAYGATLTTVGIIDRAFKRR